MEHYISYFREYERPLAASCVAHMLTDMAMQGDTCLEEESPTVFDALAAPGISLDKYLTRIQCSFD